MKRLAGLLIAICTVVTLHAQDDSLSLDSILDDLLFEEPDLYELFDGSTNFHFLYWSTSANTKTFYAGREIGDNQFNASAQFYYFISNGLYFGASGAWYNQFDPGFRSAVVSAGYSNGFTKIPFLRYRGSYNRYIYLNMGTDFVPTITSDINAGLTARGKVVGTRADYSLLMGTDYMHQVSWDVFAKIKLFSLKGYDKIQFEPEVSNLFGTEIFETDIATGDITDPFYVPNYVLTEKFGLMNTQITLPLSISFKNIDFEVAYIYNIPRSLDPVYYYDNTGYFRFSLGYIFSIK